jgi:hypothetical protein
VTAVRVVPNGVRGPVSHIETQVECIAFGAMFKHG